MFIRRLRLSIGGGSITYHFRDKQQVVVSGEKAGKIYYQKSVLSCGDQIWTTLCLSYPEAAEKGV